MSDFIDFTGSGRGLTTYGQLTNSEILALPSPSDGQSAFSTTDFIVYNFFDGSWYSTGGGILV